MLLKLASMFLTNIFYYLKVIFKIKKRDARLLYFWIILYKFYDIYLKVDSSLANTKLRHSANKFVVTFKFLKHFSLLVCPHQNIIRIHWVSLSNFFTNSIASLGLLVFFIDSFKPFVSISSLLISESRSLCNNWSSLSFGCLLVSPKI